MESLRDSLMGGVNFSDPHLGGETCRDHVSYSFRLAETIAGLSVLALSLYLSRDCWKTSNNNNNNNNKAHSPSQAQLWLLVLLSFVFGVEVGYKFASRTVIHLLFPCHAVTVSWLWLLSSRRPSQLTFRCLMNLTHGAAAGLLFPAMDDLLLPGEQAVYWVQHTLVFLLPFYFAAFEGDSFRLPRGLFNRDVASHVLYAFALWVFYHFVVMQSVSLLTLANIGHMLCPAVSDPFADMWPSYLILGICHQFGATLISAVLAAAVASMFQSRKTEEDALSRPIKKDS